MKRLLFFPAIFLCAFSLFISSCKKNIDVKNPVIPGNTFTVPAATPVMGSVAGRVTDENDVAVSGAVVNCGGMNATTNINGVFTFDNITLDKYVSTVTVTKSGYYKGIRSFSANPTRNYVDIKLLPKALAGTYTSANAGTITLSNSTEIKFQSNSVIVKSTGAAFTGTVNVYATYIDPTRSDIGSIVPGSFMARDGNSMYTLQSTGMIAVDLESSTGEALQLATNKPASIKLPIASSLLSNAPATIDTWSLDDKGVWIKEGTATKVGSNYEMEVTHFSFWNCDVPANAIYLTLHVQDQNAVSLRNTLVKLTIPNNNSWWANTYGRTDSAGNVSGLVPAGLGLVLNILPGYNCSSSYTENIGPFTVNTSLTITATLAAQQSFTVTGTATSCSGALDSAVAYIYLNNGSYVYTNVVNGSYSHTFSGCSNPTSVYVSIRNRNNFSNSIQLAVTGNNIVVPAIQVCQPTTTTATFGACQIATVSGVLTQGVPANQNNIMSISINVLTPGTYNISTNAANGIVFSGSGVITTSGSAFINLTASGTPVMAGSFTYSAQISGLTGCTTVVNVNTGTTTNAAIYTIGCNISASGTWLAGINTTSNNFVTIPVTVTTAGWFNISTATANGIYFYDSGFFQAPGVYNVNVQAYGTPLNAGSTTFNFIGSNGTPGCPVVINVQNTSGGIASYTFIGAPDSCQFFSYAGVYTTGVPMNSQNTVNISVNVTSPGSYTITSTTINGITFSRTGIFTQTGSQSIFLNSTGTPIQQGLSAFNFIGNITGCSFIIPVN